MSEQRFNRLFTKEGTHPYDEVEWKKTDAVIKDHRTGEIAFEQKGVEFPVFYSQNAINIITSKYFRGVSKEKTRETSYKQLLNRVIDTNILWGEEQGYFSSDEERGIFKDELTYILLHQMAYFNSPVWFNMGFKGREQTASACFINSIEDDMESILEFNKTEGMIFKAGSGSGVNISSLRSSYESLSTGGVSSGALSFMKVSDANAGSIKSGGATRRAAKMVIMDIDHPEIVDFINCKVREEEKAHILIRGGCESSYNGEAYATVAFQNANNSIRVSDSFMRTVLKKGKVWTKMVVSGKRYKSYEAEDLMKLIAEATYKIGDPGMQFHDLINEMNCCKSDECKASNPCGEYLAQTDTSCNLASINLMKFLDQEAGIFLVEQFVHVCRIISTAMDIWIDAADYPTEKISENTKQFRTVGLGYTNLGSLIMASGWAYDSDAAREASAAITSLMTAAVYNRSALHCDFLPPFPKWEENKKSMIEVLKTHLASSTDIEKNQFNTPILEKSHDLWKEAIYTGRNSGFRNSFATVLAPTGTISLAMDCDTTGCEPALGLVVYKLLAGSDVSIKLVNSSAGVALKKLGYDTDERKEIYEYIKANNSIEDCDLVKIEHYPVFDTAMKSKERCINYMGHLEMLSAVQPFISGGISKTINMPNEATVEQIADAYIKAWEMGIKCVAIYRDGSKGSQPLTVVKERRSRATRVRMPDDAESQRHKFTVGSMDVIVQCGKYPDGSLGEIFITASAQGSTMRGMLDCFAICFSMSLQYGLPLKELIKKFTNAQFEPHGFTGKSDIAFCSSIIDYVMKYLALNFLTEKETKSIGLFRNGTPSKEEKQIKDKNNRSMSGMEQPEENKTTGTICPTCGLPMVSNGSCEGCQQCGHSTGCS